jgi:hypothetical protein
MMRDKIFKKHYKKPSGFIRNFDDQRFLLPLLIIYAFVAHLCRFFRSSINREKNKKSKFVFLLFRDITRPAPISEIIYKEFQKIEKICKYVLLRLTECKIDYDKQYIIENEKYLVKIQFMVVCLFSSPFWNNQVSLSNPLTVQQSFQELQNKMKSFCPGRTVTYLVDKTKIEQVEKFLQDFRSHCEQLGRKIKLSENTETNTTLSEIQKHAIEHVHKT